jgi:hypothetical protein
VSVVRHSWLIDLLWSRGRTCGKAMCHVNVVGRLAPWSVGFAPVREQGQLCRPVVRHDTQRKYLRSGGNLKLRPVPRTERNKDNKTLNYTSTPPGANILLVAVGNVILVLLLSVEQKDVPIYLLSTVPQSLVILFCHFNRNYKNY